MPGGSNSSQTGDSFFFFFPPLKEILNRTLVYKAHRCGMVLVEVGYLNPGPPDTHVGSSRKWFLDLAAGVTRVKVVTAVGEMTIPRN